ncbi:MAG: hypothetical protein CO105_03785 [Comamonadaceae bacterium CG_4_9_14_3_um_filter_60_33]|nr:MAG: hypothetical protein AUK51_17100 [Comamonadaceae bacterium CG2_30_59_20]PIY29815.1 MAG: hypothetical protein COZ09_02840 [Comamonadaceae bacterium CG_4_10_14_3_um_filter_60_42]PJB45489.1 MAG: hypothetical protein CO105_03785 [Comamonadaceae bacterium CG_4_9_14_3_um_filter_60_33]
MVVALNYEILGKIKNYLFKLWKIIHPIGLASLIVTAIHLTIGSSCGIECPLRNAGSVILNDEFL